MTNTTPPRMDSGAPMDGLSVPTDGAPGSTCLPLGMAEAPAVVLAAELNYRGAWERVLEKSGMPGTDGVTTSRFKRMADGALKNLEADLAGGVYRPLPLRMAQLEKKSGGALIHEIAAAAPDEQHLAARSDSVGLPIPQAKEAKVAKKGQGRGEKTES